MKKCNVLSGLAALLLSTSAFSAATINYADPVPEKGIGYEWTVDMEHKGVLTTADFVRHVGAKSSFEPSNPAPEVGWQHTSDWVALQLREKSLLTIEVSNQRGVHFTTVGTDGKAVESTAGQGYFPAFSLYSGWDDTSTEVHTFNPVGNFWSTVKFIDAAYIQQAQAIHGGEVVRSIKKQFILPAGKYSINIGGINALYCDTTLPCYNGRHGYRAKLSAEPMPKAVE
ncbi:MAG: hypothetical protein NTV00_13955 [Methylococcales bacterium]|nr:hypothetical protein [Methylococcales bacterium]